MIITSFHVERDEPTELRWSGTAHTIPMLDIAGGSVYLDMLGADLGPWLLALSDQLAEFATTVTPEGTPKPVAVSA